ncbi:MAG TPA: hypothetical protein VMY35_00890 [Phycisphaerae bacterium]|nr:hypothetical protein [Phycisphaerae bacterium]
MTTPKRNPFDPSRRARVWCAVAVGVAIAAGLFSAAVGANLVARWVESLRWDPFDSAELAHLREEAMADGFSDEAAVERIREFERTLREEYFYRGRFARMGGWMLMGGVLVFLVSAKTAAACLRRAPAPPHAGGVEADGGRAARAARWAVVLIGLALAAALAAVAAGALGV